MAGTRKSIDCSAARESTRRPSREPAPPRLYDALSSVGQGSLLIIAEASFGFPAFGVARIVRVCRTARLSRAGVIFVVQGARRDPLQLARAERGS